MAAIFLPLSALIYFIHYLIFRDPHHIFIYLVGDLALMPLEVFLVVIAIERLLSIREKREMMQKLSLTWLLVYFIVRWATISCRTCFLHLRNGKR